MRIFVFEEDPSFQKLLTYLFEKSGHEVQVFQSDYSCPLYLKEACECPADHRCADAVLVNIRPPSTKNINILIDQAAKGCKLLKANKAVLSTTFTEELENLIQDHGFEAIKKPSRLSKIQEWLEECSQRLMVR